MDENSKLDELAEAADREPGDAQNARRLLAAASDAADLPARVKQFFARSAATVEAFDVDIGDQAALAHQLGFYREDNSEPAGYDLDHIFEWFTDRMTRGTEQGKKINVSRTAREYNEEVMKFRGQPDGVRKAYEKARKRFADQQAAEITLVKLLSEI
ncbi:MAG: hypothetical protein COB16_12695 [Rhodobacteraceae bacterium]|nr:MAG: hypothetical protein COB16_12695 [Paracoccaceae bacterium]